MKHLLIANRGEIAVRIIRACREADISPIAVYSDADRESLHVALADAAYPIGASPVSDSYHRISRILQVARAAGADAIHPGYGFLADNAGLAQACSDIGITFVGPPARVIRMLGDKIAVKGLMAAAGLPVVPGYSGDDQTIERVREEAQLIEPPLVIKAAGGGGHGLRVVRNLEDFDEAWEGARREARATYRDERLLLERWFERPRHIELQVVVDAHGEMVHLHERECSIQRCSQKIVEESPSPIVTSELRERIVEAGLLAARTVGYVNAGTIEFLVEERPDGEPDLYFTEIHPRLQAEHPVTEMASGVDLVRLQLRIASGEPLPFKQEQVAVSGCAIEARICAEDPALGFIPCVGNLDQWITPAGPGVRVDSGVERGSSVSSFYDPVLAKLIVHGADRAAAIARMGRALTEFHVLGVRTNIPYLRAIFAHPAFRSGETHTAFLTEHLADWAPATTVPDEVMLALAAEAMTRPEPAVGREPADEADLRSPWRSASGWRNA